MADPTGFEPAISALTGPHVRPLHHGSNTPSRADKIIPEPRPFVNRSVHAVHTCTQKLSDGEWQVGPTHAHGCPFTTEPRCPCFGCAHSSGDNPLRARTFETLRNDLLAATFDGAAANQVTVCSILVVPQVGLVVGETRPSHKSVVACSSQRSHEAACVKAA